MNLERFIRSHGLPEAFADSAEHFHLPFAETLEQLLRKNDGRTLVLGINGAQGTGKSTLSELIADYLAEEHGRRVSVLSLDDLYLTRAERESLGKKVHPLLRTRGVPGTHDVELGLDVIENLKALKPGTSMTVPRFDKSRDDRAPRQEWTSVTGPVDLLIFEGWCIASQPSAPAALQDPVNTLESTMDADGRWRKYVNEKLGNDYARLFASIDILLFLQVPGFDAVYRWRLEQEHKLRERAGESACAVMSDAEVSEFIQYYERITRANIALLPSIADAIIELDESHQSVALRYPQRD